MIANPFLNRFKSSHQDKPSINKPASDEKLLLRMCSFSLKLEDDNETLLKISRTISYNFDVDTVCISKVSNSQVEVQQCFHDGENVGTKLKNRNLNSINMETIKTKHEQYYERLAEQFGEDYLVNYFNATSCLCVPTVDETGNVSAVINIFHRSPKNYSLYQTEILKLFAQRTALFFQREKAKEQEFEKADNRDPDVHQQLAQANEQLEATNKSLESLSFAVSHELRAPLRSVDNFSKALAEDFTSSLPEEAVGYISRIRKSCERMGHMIDDLLWLARVSRRKLELQDVDLSKLVSKIGQDLIAEEENRVIELEIEPNLFVTADKELLKISLQHLLSNAIKFSKKRDTAKIEFFSENHNGTSIFVLRDNGKGFDMAYYDQLFEPFKKLHRSEKFDGTGIGLATVEQIIHRHHGKIWAESDTDDGASFYFSLPSD